MGGRSLSRDITVIIGNGFCPVGYGLIRPRVGTDSVWSDEISNTITENIGLDSSNFSWQQGYGAFSVGPSQVSENGPLHRAAARTSSDTNPLRKVYSLP
jgi:hypothetical protein